MLLGGTVLLFPFFAWRAHVDAPTRSSSQIARQSPSMCASSQGDAAARFERVSHLEEALASAVACEDFSLAASLRDKLQALRMDEEVAVLSANAAFYRAFSNGDIRQMQQAWIAESEASFAACLHPGVAPIYGHGAIMDSWREIFDGGVQPTVTTTALRVRLLHGSSSACVTLIERIADSKLVATNIFEKGGDGRWRMSLHQAGPLMASIP